MRTQVTSAAVRHSMRGSGKAGAPATAAATHLGRAATAQQATISEARMILGEDRASMSFHSCIIRSK